MDDTTTPWAEGLTYQGPTTDFYGRVVKQELRLGRSDSLRALQEEYSFFTPAIVYLLGVVADQPLIDLMYEVQQDIPFYFKKFRWPLFRRLETATGDIDWNHGLWAVRREHWEVFLDFYCSIAVRVLSTNLVNRIAAQEVDIIDPLAIERVGLLAGKAPTMKVMAFGVNGSKFIAAFEQKADPLLDPPTLRFYPPNKSTIIYAQALVAGDNPHIAEDIYLESENVKERKNPL